MTDIIAPLVIAHRGLRSEIPENTLESVAAALRLPGLHGVEFDVEMTRDRRPVVLHQETVVPSSDFTRVELAERNYHSRDWVIELSAQEVLKLDAGSWKGLECAHLRVPLLSEVLSLSWGNKVAYVELKDATYWGERDPSRPTQIVESALPDLLAFSGALNVVSFNPEVLRVLGESAPHIPRTLALWTEWRSRTAEAVAEAQRSGAATISLPDTLLLEAPEWIRTAHEQGLKIHTYPVSPAYDEPEFLNWTPASQVEKWRRLRELGVDAILSDFARETVMELSEKMGTPT